MFCETFWQLSYNSLCIRIFQIVNIYMGVFVALLIVTTVLSVAAKRCEQYILSELHGGRSCNGEGIVNHKLLHHQCLHLCLQSTTCKAYNYNNNERTCTRFASPCPRADSDPLVEFVVFRKTPINKCYEWVPYRSGEPLDERMIATDIPWYIVARLHVNGNHVVCYFSTISVSC